jgi:hypothetical protein
VATGRLGAKQQFGYLDCIRLGPVAQRQSRGLIKQLGRRQQELSNLQNRLFFTGEIYVEAGGQ